MVPPFVEMLQKVGALFKFNSIVKNDETLNKLATEVWNTLISSDILHKNDKHIV